MWYKAARRMITSGFGSFPTRKRPADNVATPLEAHQMAQEAILSRQPKPWSQRTIEERLDGLRPDLDNYVKPTAEALLDSAGVQPAAMGNETNQAGRPRSGGGRNPALRGSFPTSPDPASRLQTR